MLFDRQLLYIALTFGARSASGLAIERPLSLDDKASVLPNPSAAISTSDGAAQATRLSSLSEYVSHPHDFLRRNADPTAINSAAQVALSSPERVAPNSLPSSGVLLPGLASATHTSTKHLITPSAHLPEDHIRRQDFGSSAMAVSLSGLSELFSLLPSNLASPLESEYSQYVTYLEPTAATASNQPSATGSVPTSGNSATGSQSTQETAQSSAQSAKSTGATSQSSAALSQSSTAGSSSASNSQSASISSSASNLQSPSTSSVSNTQSSASKSRSVSNSQSSASNTKSAALSTQSDQTRQSTKTNTDSSKPATRSSPTKSQNTKSDPKPMQTDPPPRTTRHTSHLLTTRTHTTNTGTHTSYPTTMHTSMHTGGTSTPTLGAGNSQPTSGTDPSQPIANAAVAGIASGLSAGAVMVALAGFWIWRRKKQGKPLFGPRASQRSTGSSVYPKVAWLYDPRQSPPHSRAGSDAGQNLMADQAAENAPEMAQMSGANGSPQMRAAEADEPLLPAITITRDESPGHSPPRFGRRGRPMTSMHEDDV